jgi:drug/metabolite transporter (DMT)-like permease
MIYSYVLAICTSILYGAATIIEKHVMVVFDPSYVFTSFGLIYGLVAMVAYLYNKSLFQTYMKKRFVYHHMWLLAAIVCALILPQLLFLHAVKHHDDIHIVSALSSLGPLVTMLILMLFFKKRLTVISMIGVILVVIGGLVLLTQ